MKRVSRAHLALSFALGSLVALLALPAVAFAGEFPVCTRTGNQTCPAVSGGRIVYTDESGGANAYQVYVFDVVTKTEQAVSPGSYSQDWAAIDGNLVAWSQYFGPPTGFQLYSRTLPGGSAAAVAAQTGSQMNVCVSDGVVVWVQDYTIYRKGPGDVAPVAITADRRSYESEDSLAFDDGRVAFAYRNNVTGASHDLGYVSVSGGTPTMIRVDAAKTLDASKPDISGDRIVWQDNRNGNYDIYLYDISTGQERRITTGTGDQVEPAISGDTIVYIDGAADHSSANAVAYDIATGTKRVLNSAGIASEPDVDGDIAVWWDTRSPGTGGGDYNVYAYDLSVPDTFTKWTKRTSGTIQPVIGLDFVGNKVGWAVGYGGTILKTTDAGVTWKAQTSGTTVELCGVDMVDATTGWIVGYDRPNNAAVILKTTDGGATWVPQAHPSPAGAYPADVLALDATTAFGFGGGILPGQNLFWTQDGGAGWAIHPNAPSGTNLTSVSQLVGGTAWGVGAQSGLVKTTDSGLSWARVAHPTNGQERFMGAIALDAATAVIVGDDAPTTEATGLVLRTPDGGATWTTPKLPGTQQLREIDGVAGHLWIVGEGGVVYHSDDGGLTWGKQVLPAGTLGLWNVDYRSPDLICAVGLGGTIVTGMRPTATLARPVAPASVKRGAYFTVTGTLKPRHSGSTPLTFYRKKSGKWVKYKTVNARNADYSTYTKYKLKYKLPYAGSWYVVASHSCTLHRSSVSAKEYFSVK